MGPTEIPSQSTETIKIPTAHYEFGANYIDPKVSGCYNSYIGRKLFDDCNFNQVMVLMVFPQLMLIGRVLTDGRLNARVKCDLSDNLSLKANAQAKFY